MGIAKGLDFGLEKGAFFWRAICGWNLPEEDKGAGDNDD